MYPTLKKRSGFTLIEAIIAMSVLAFAAAAILLPFTSAANVQAESDLRTIATKLAADKLEDVIANNDIFDDSELTGQVKDASGNIFDDSMYDRFSRFVSCKDAQVGGVDLKWVTVTVRYNGQVISALSTLVMP